MNELCNEQEVCSDYQWEHKKRVHHIRITVPCGHWVNEACDLLRGQSCNIEKIEKLRKQK